MKRLEQLAAARDRALEHTAGEVEPLARVLLFEPIVRHVELKALGDHVGQKAGTQKALVNDARLSGSRDDATFAGAVAIRGTLPLVNDRDFDSLEFTSLFKDDGMQCAPATAGKLIFGKFEESRDDREVLRELVAAALLLGQLRGVGLLDFDVTCHSGLLGDALCVCD